MRVLLTRSADNCSKTAARLAAVGHGCVILPMLVYVETGENWPDGRFDAVVFTSAAAVQGAERHINARPGAKGLLSVTAYCVGEASALAAREAGFVNVIAGPGDSHQLAELIALSGSGGNLLYPAPVHKAFDFASALAGWQVSEFALYEARLTDPGRQALEAALRQSDALFVYSPRMAAHLSKIMHGHGLLGQLGNLTLIAISEKTALAFGEAAGIEFHVPGEPSEASMIGLLSGTLSDPMH